VLKSFEILVIFTDRERARMGKGGEEGPAKRGETAAVAALPLASLIVYL